MEGARPLTLQVPAAAPRLEPESSLRLLAEAQPLETRLFVPPDDSTEAPEISIVIPTLNEEVTITEFVAWCRQGLERSAVNGEILIVDSSTDATPERALAAGARILRTPKRGLGSAYIDSLPYIRGRYVLLGDADLTYDFRDFDAFLERFREGYEFILGSRFKGCIEAGAMPALHRYFGTPLTTWILNRLYSTTFSDIHCGMRGITRDALLRMDLQSKGWEYASEMVVKSVQMELRIAEVPVTFLKDREGRVSHHKRAGWLSPWLAGWSNLRSMLVHGAEFFALRPGLFLLAIGLALTLPLSLGPVSVGSFTFSLYWMLLGMTLSVAGLQAFYLGCLSQLFHDYNGSAQRRWLRIFRYNRSILSSAILTLLGIGCVTPLMTEYVQQGLTLSGRIGSRHHLAILGLLFVLAGSANFIFTLVLHAAVSANQAGRRGDLAAAAGRTQ
jgi:glycosyltransferase involved in cell wall biosynthesis